MNLESQEDEVKSGILLFHYLILASMINTYTLKQRVDERRDCGAFTQNNETP